MCGVNVLCAVLTVICGDVRGICKQASAMLARSLWFCRVEVLCLQIHMGNTRKLHKQASAKVARICGFAGWRCCACKYIWVTQESCTRRHQQRLCASVVLQDGDAALANTYGSHKKVAQAGISNASTQSVVLQD